MLYIPIFLLSCFLLLLWLLTILYKCITSKIRDFYKHEDVSISNMKFAHICTIIIVVISMFISTIELFYDNIFFSIIILVLSLIVTVFFAVFFYCNHYLATKKTIDDKKLKYKKIRLFSAILLSIVIIDLCIISYVFSFVK